MDLFDNISPLDYRYYGREKKTFDALNPFLSENARIKYLTKVETALVIVLAKKGICSNAVAKEIGDACMRVTAEEMYAEEDKTKHDIRGLVNVIRSKVSDEAKPFVHFSATSYDIVDTANALRFKEVTETILLPALLQFEKTLMDLAEREKSTVQMGRTHGQHAVPITFGLPIATYVSRLGGRIKHIQETKNKLCGKFSGAVGAYNASSLLIENPLEFEQLIMQELQLTPSISSTQVVEAEPMSDYMHALISCFGVIANFADDMRHLQRSELGEVGEAFEAGQVGSSTMPQKRNPWNFENVKSFWKASFPRMITVYMDQISEHQRDLTNSASQRFLPEVVASLYLSVTRLNRIVSKLTVDHANMQKNFDQSKQMIIAEPLYILLAFYGHPNAHEAIKQLTLKSQTEKKPLFELALADAELKPYLERFTATQKSILENPEKYVGIAPQKTEQIVNYWKNELHL